MDLAVVIDSDDPDNGSGVTIAGEQHCARPHATRRDSVGERRPTEPVVVLIVQVCDEVQVIH